MMTESKDMLLGGGVEKGEQDRRMEGKGSYIPSLIFVNVVIEQ